MLRVSWIRGFRCLLVGALLIALPTPLLAAGKAFQPNDLKDASIKLEAQIKTEAGAVTRPLATLRREADAALGKRDGRIAVERLGQIVSLQPNDAGAWLRLASAVLQFLPSAENEERGAALERASAAAYAAYDRAATRNDEAAGLALLGRALGERKMWRPALDAWRLALELRETADLRANYEGMRAEHGFRMLDYSVDSDAASPRACFQFSEELPGKRTDFTPFVAVAGMDRPALSVDEKQLCVEGLKHGERYAITLRAGLPSTVRENLTKSAEVTIYVRDRKPLVRFTSRAYVLPRTGQRGIPVVSVNTDKVTARIYRVGDRNLLEAVVGGSFQRQLDRSAAERLAQARGNEVWKGEMAVESPLNAEVTTAFPVTDALGEIKPGVYFIVAEPGSRKGDDDDALATQWFIVSDLGLTAYSGSDGIHVVVQSLASAEAKAGVEVKLLARNNEVLASRKSDGDGVARFEPGLSRGEGGLAPALVVASEAAGDYAFLSLKSQAFDFSDRGVAGRPAPAGLDAFVFAERGVYRTGESVHLTALLRDAKGAAAPGLPLTLVLERPDGVEYRRTAVPDAGLGGRSLTVPLVDTAPTGTWRVRAFVDPNAPAVGQTSFMVEDYVPDRLEFELAARTPVISRTQPAELSLEGRFLYGAPASGLSLEGEVTVSAAKERPGLAGYEFGLADEDVTVERQPLADLPPTDKDGRAQIKVALAKVPSTTRALEAQVTVRMAEPGGRAVQRSVTLPVAATGPMIGVKPLFAGKNLGDGDPATFEVALFAPDGRRLDAKRLHYELLQIENRYQWYRQGGSWEYEPVKQTRRVADGLLDAPPDAPGRLSLPVSWGRYRLEVSTGDPNGPATSVAFDTGVYTEASADTPDRLEIALDKAGYRPGERMAVSVTARSAGKLTLSVMSDRLLSTTTADVQVGTAQVPLTVGDDWGTGAYVVATLRRPLEAAADRMPGRAIGVQWFTIGRAAHTLGVALETPALARPGSTLRVPVRLAGLRAGEDARVVVAAVDLGILNLTSYKPPAPEDFYLGQRRLGAEVRDLYGQLIDGTQGSRGQIRTGGDAAGAISGSPPTQPPLALYSGLLTVGPDGTAEAAFELPPFAGTVRVMAVAWSGDKVGHASSDVAVRDPVVLTATLPRFLRIGDRGGLRLDLDNVEGQEGDYRVSVAAEGPLSLEAPAEQTMRLAAKERSGLRIPVSVASAGTGTVTVGVTGPDGFALERSYTLPLRPATQVLARRTVRTLGGGESVTISSDMLADLVPGTGSVSLSIGRSAALDVAPLLQALDRYPYGCSEQIASRALPLLYANELATETGLALDTGLDGRIRDAVARLLARQDSNGSFGLWSAGGGDAWLDAYVTDFLTRARERGFPVPDTAFKLALDRLRNSLSSLDEQLKNGGREISYALYVLARNASAPIGDLRYVADTKLGELATPIAKAQIAAALALMGDKLRAERAYAAALANFEPRPKLEVGRADYGSALRDAAALATLAGESGAPTATVVSAVERIEAARELSPVTSTQESAWLVLAARALGKESRVALDVSGEAVRGAFNRTLSGEALAGAPVKVTNTGDAPLQAVVTVAGAPLVPEPATERGFKIERLFRTLEGAPADPARAKQNQRFVVLLRMTEPKPEFARIIVTDWVPAGFEIDNPRLVSSGETGTLPWIENAAEPAHTEFRDERFAAAFERKNGDPASFTVAYVVRAVSPGRYMLPQASVEDMYRPDRFGRTGTGTVEVEAAR